MLLYLIFTACLSGQCQKIELPWDGGVIECQLHAQFALAQWSIEHPGYVLGRHRCESGRPA